MTGTLAVEGGVVNPNGRHRAGTLIVDGNYQQGHGGELDADIRSKSSADLISVSGTASLSGVLAGVTRSGWVPPAGTSARVLMAKSISGQFDCVRSQGAGPLQWRADYGPTRVTLKAMLPAPSGCAAFHAMMPERVVRGTTVAGAGNVTSDAYGKVAVTEPRMAAPVADQRLAKRVRAQARQLPSSSRQVP